MLISSNLFNLFAEDKSGDLYQLHETHINGLNMIYAIYQSSQYKNLFCVMGKNSKEFLLLDRSHENCINWIYDLER